MNIDINELTIGQAKELAALFCGSENSQPKTLATQYVGRHVIIRTYSAGVWFGELAEKSGNEVILDNARRMWRWQAAKSISLSGVAKYGIDRDKSKIAPAVDAVWLEAIEIIPTTPESALSISGADDVKAE
ncbi:DUF6948 domain-containing protein [Entomohabitans teleogrylli]|uniref:DUF6948 domain-containing protein n=1 Tax=Entomohabitans teleogrylli TaxID=1384589 RepID=UPI00073D229C|nr:hypothetical protein [Entomohabitans teleogrylli]